MDRPFPIGLIRLEYQRLALVIHRKRTVVPYSGNSIQTLLPEKRTWLPTTGRSCISGRKRLQPFPFRPSARPIHATIETSKIRFQERELWSIPEEMDPFLRIHRMRMLRRDREDRERKNTCGYFCRKYNHAIQPCPVRHDATRAVVQAGRDYHRRIACLHTDSQHQGVDQWISGKNKAYKINIKKRWKSSITF